MSEIKAEWTNKDNLGIETTASDYIKRDDARESIGARQIPIDQLYYTNSWRKQLVQVTSKLT